MDKDIFVSNNRVVIVFHDASGILHVSAGEAVSWKDEVHIREDSGLEVFIKPEQISEVRAI